MRPTFDLSNVLAFAPRDTPLAVVAILDGAVREACARLGVHEGDRITCNETLAESLLVRDANGRRVLLSMPEALLIEVEPGLPS